jgi:hypothetical protein
MLIKLGGKSVVCLEILIIKNDLFFSQKLTDFPLEAINMLDFLTMFIHYGDLPIKVRILKKLKY